MKVMIRQLGYLSIISTRILQKIIEPPEYRYTVRELAHAFIEPEKSHDLSYVT